MRLKSIEVMCLKSVGVVRLKLVGVVRLKSVGVVRLQSIGVVHQISVEVMRLKSVGVMHLKSAGLMNLKSEAPELRVVFLRPHGVFEAGGVSLRPGSCLLDHIYGLRPKLCQTEFLKRILNSKNFDTNESLFKEKF